MPNDAEVNRIALKLPPFWVKNPELWFVNIEAQFNVAGITNDSTQYYAVVAALDAETLSYVSDLVRQKPDKDLFKTLKERLVSEFSDSEQKRIQTLLSELPLGDDKPSHLLRKMRQLADNKIGEDILKTLWFQRLPNQAQAILSVSTEKLDQLAIMADKIIETCNPVQAQCHAIAASNPDAINELKKQIAELTERVSRLTYRDNRNKNFQRSRSRRKFQSPRRQQDLCFYHNKFGVKARKCRQPCNFTQPEN